MQCRIKIGSSLKFFFFANIRFALKNCFSANNILSGCPNSYIGNECKQQCRYQNNGKECQILCRCNLDFCNHIDGCNFSKIESKIYEYFCLITMLMQKKKNQKHIGFINT